MGVLYPCYRAAAVGKGRAIMEMTRPTRPGGDEVCTLLPCRPGGRPRSTFACEPSLAARSFPRTVRNASRGLTVPTARQALIDANIFDNTR